MKQFSKCSSHHRWYLRIQYHHGDTRIHLPHWYGSSKQQQTFTERQFGDGAQVAGADQRQS